MSRIPKARTFRGLGKDGELLVLCVTPQDLKGGRGSAARTGSPSLSDIDRELGGRLMRQLKREEFKASPRSTVVLKIPHAKQFLTICLFGWKAKHATRYGEMLAYRNLGNFLVAQSRAHRAKSVALSAHGLVLNRADTMGAMIEGMLLGSYEFGRYKSGKKAKPAKLPELIVLTKQRIKSGAAAQAHAVGQGTLHARDLVNMPPNHCTPTYLRQYARALAKRTRLKIEVFDRKRLTKMKAGSLLSVAQGSDEPPYLIKLTYRPRKKRAKVVSIVGKGVTFDSGGLSIKPGTGMMAMKCDMSGAAAVLGAMEAVAALKPGCEVRAYIPTTENMINGSATRPGDIVRASNGKTIEILNTDAEGRLILADALVLAEKDGADVIIDLATLTGACVTALGEEYAGLFTANNELADALIQAADEASELLWRLPLAAEYRDQIKSSVADIKNIGGSGGGAITAALFLSEFVKKTPWAHIDIAGPAFASGDKTFVKKGGTGFGVRTLVNFILSR